MQEERGSAVEQRLVALLDALPLHEQLRYELDPECPALDGADAWAGPAEAGEAPDGCTEGVGDADALSWAAAPPGADAVDALALLVEHLTDDLETACAPVPDAPGDGTACEAVERPVEGVVSDAVLVEAVAAAERCLAHVTSLREALVGVFGARRRAEAEADVAAARAATAADGVGRPWARQVRSTAPTELAARLGVSTGAAAAMVERGAAVMGAHRAVGDAMSSGGVSAAAGSWLLDELTELHVRTRLTAVERETAQGTAVRALERSVEDEVRHENGLAPLTPEELRARTAADTAEVEAAAEAAGLARADAVTAEVRTRLLARAAASSSAGGQGADGLGTTRRGWRRQLDRAVLAADPSGAAARARQERTRRSVTHWSEADGQACLQLRGPAEDVALIGAAMDARAERRRDEARAAERAAAKAEGRPFDRSAVGTLDAHRFEALKEWAVAALELADTSGRSGTWYPVARTAASRPVVHLVLPVDVALGVTDVGAWLTGHGPLGAEAAVRIAEDATWRRVFSDPVTGAAVGVEERTYRPSTSLRRLVRLRHATSTMPGSDRSAEDCDLDHVEPHRDDGSGGATTASNLHPLSEADHLLKQAGEHGPPGHGWRVVADPDGQGVVWRAPTGHTYRVRPDVIAASQPGQPSAVSELDEPDDLTPGGAW